MPKAPDGKFYVDVSAAAHKRAGLGRYAGSLAQALALAVPERLALFYNRERGIDLPEGLGQFPARTLSMGYKPWRMLVWLANLAGMGFDRFFPDAALFHSTEHLLIPFHSVPTVLTVHDLIFRQFPQHHKPLNRLYLNLTMPLYVRRADAIIAISETTKRDLMGAYGVPERKIHVIYEAASPRFHPQQPEAVERAKSKYGLPERYILFVGTIEPRKNLISLLEAFQEIKRSGLTDALVIVGKRGWLYDDFFRRLEQSPDRDSVLFPGFVPDEDLPAIYAGAQVLALPSLYEGFGLPALEAMACGTPVIASHAGSLHEVCEDAAVYVDPEDTGSLILALSLILGKEDAAEEMRSRGLVRASQFSWEKTALETLDVYSLVME